MAKWFTTLILLIQHSILLSQIYHISERAQFHHPEKLSKLSFPMIWIDHVQNEKVAILVHGYNNDLEEASEFYKPMCENLKGQYDSIVCYYWPGFDDFWEYTSARNMATASPLSQRLCNLLRDLHLQAKQVDIIAFSTGCRLVLEALKRTNEKLIDNLFLLAPAVDNEALGFRERYFSSVNNTEKTFVFYSKNDPILRWGYPLFEWDRSLGSSGPQDRHALCSHVHVIDATPYIHRHHDYVISPFVIDIISNVHHVDQQLATAP